MNFDNQIDSILKTRQIEVFEGFYSELHFKFTDLLELESHEFEKTSNPYSVFDLRATIAESVSLRMLHESLRGMISEIFYPYFGAISIQSFKESAKFRFVTVGEMRGFVTGTITVSGSNYCELAREFENERNLVLKNIEV